MSRVRTIASARLRGLLAVLLALAALVTLAAPVRADAPDLRSFASGIGRNIAPWSPVCVQSGPNCVAQFGAVNWASSRWLGNTYVSIFDYLTPADRNDIIQRTLVDKSTVLNAALAAAPAGNVYFPNGAYLLGASLVVTKAQNIVCGSRDGGASSVFATTIGLNAPLIRFSAAGGVKGCDLEGDVTSGTQNGQSLVLIDGVNNVVLDDNFYSGGYNGVEIAGSAFYTIISNSQFTGQYHRFINANAPVTGCPGGCPGFDLTITNTKFLGGTVTMDYGWQFDGLGSLIASNVVMSVGHYISGTVYWNRRADNFGGVQVSNSVFEGGDPGAAVWIVGAPGAAAWNNFHTVNTLLTAGLGGGGGGAPALQCINASRFRFTGGAIASSATTGSVVSFPPAAICTEFMFNGTSYNANNPIDIFTTTTNDVTVSGSIVAPDWASATPLVDFTATTTAANIPYLDVVGGNPGSSGTPVLLPSGVPGVRCYLNVTCVNLANPTATIGLTAVNGTAGTPMRSDAAPALSQAIAPTWTGTHTFAEAIVSTKATGTPPFTVASTSKVVNLYADRAASADALASTGFANPTASGGLTAVNGTATTAMRSDAAPALSQAITPTWTQLHTFTNSMLAMLGSSTGKTTLTSDNAGASNFTIHIPAANDTFALLAATQALSNKDLTSGTNTFPTFNQNTTGSAAKWTTARLLAGNSVDGSANVAFPNKFIVQGTTDTGLTGAQFLGALGTCILKNTTTTGVLSCTTAGTDYLTSVGATFTGGLISISSSPLTANGTLGFTVAGTSGGIPYFSGTTTWASSALLAANAIMIGGGAGTAPSTTTTGTGVLTALGNSVSGSGALCLVTSCTMITPALGTPSSVNLSNATSLATSALGGLSKLYVPLGSNQNITVAGTYVDGPSLGQATTAGFTWYVSGHVALTDGTNAELYSCKLWDGTTIIDSASVSVTANFTGSMSLAGFITSPAASIRVSCTASNTTSFINTNSSGNGKDSSIVGFRIN